MSTGAEDKDVPQGHEPFFDRWSRRKAEARQESPPAVRDQDSAAKTPPPELPPVEKLTFDSDYRDFFHPKVSEDTRRAALKKLFSDPRFNVMDGLDVYIDDYSKTDPIPPAMLAGLRQAQKILEWAKGQDPEKKEAGTEERASPDSSAVLQVGSPSATALDPAEQTAGNNVPLPSEPPEQGRKS